MSTSKKTEVENLEKNDSVISYSARSYRLIERSGSTEQKEQNFGESLFDPSGFVPLEVLIRQQQLAGERALLDRRMFDYEDWNDIYLSEDVPTFADDFEAMEFLQRIEEKKQKLLAQRQEEFRKDFDEFLAYRNANAKKENVNANLEQEIESKPTMSKTSPEVGSGETSPADTE